MKSKAAIADHPLHPMLIVVPAGAFITALVLDFVYAVSGVEVWWNAATPVILIGLIGAGVAAIPGLIDLFTIGRRDRHNFKVGLAHGGINLVVVAIFLWNLLTRWGEPAPGVGVWSLEFWLSLLGVATLSVSGWLGWMLVYEHHMGVVGDELVPAEDLIDPAHRHPPGEPIAH